MNEKELLSRVLMGARRAAHDIGETMVSPETDDAGELTGRMLVFASDKTFQITLTVEDVTGD